MKPEREAEIRLEIEQQKASAFGGRASSTSRVPLGMTYDLLAAPDASRAAHQEALARAERAEAERDEAQRTVAEMRGPRDERVEGIRRRARALIESDPVAALANVATALAVGDVETAERQRDQAQAALASSRDLHEKSMNTLHRFAGIKRDGLAALIAWIEDAQETRAALVGLREAAEACAKVNGLPSIVGAEQYDALDAALAATPASLAGLVRGRVLREAADAYERETRLHKPPPATWLRALADEAERST